jgi:hypothetical protein
MPRWAIRRLQKHVVSVYPQTLAKLEETYPLAVTHLLLNYHLWTGAYSGTTGLGNVIASLSNDEYQLHIKRVLNYKPWDKRRQKPKR